ncbi:hypothetical protein KY290_007729 [Solanum tuberosum]|uniref:Gag-pol polyprotein n=1 Tax=Solanum tuberosum TaxID=4113 RepID=A0ABQ7W6D9_SOLTU|nr:hypothetical protein KY290_007729 [Solanum tuberosum]
MKSLVNRMDRPERNDQHNIAPTQTHAPLQAPAQTYTFGNKEALRVLGCSSERSVELATYKLKDMANTCYEIVLLGRPTGAAPLKWDEFTKLFMDNFLPNSQRQKYATQFERSLEAVDLARKIEDKGREERAAYDVRKKAKIGGSYSASTYKPHHINGIQGQSPSQGHRNSGRMYYTALSYQTCVAPTQTTPIGRGNRGRGAGDSFTRNQGKGNAGRGQSRVFALTRQDLQASNMVVTGGQVPEIGKIISLMKAQ